MSTKLRATIEDLYRVPGKAEIVDGEIVHMSPTGAAPSYAASEIFRNFGGMGCELIERRRHQMLLVGQAGDAAHISSR